MADKILLRTGLEADAGNLDEREPGFTSDTLRAVIGDGTNPKFLASETVVSITTQAPAALAQLEHSRTSVVCDTDTAAGDVALDLTNGALLDGAVCYVHSVGTTVTRYVMVEYKAGYYKKIFVGSAVTFTWNGAEWMVPQSTESMIGKIVGGGLRYVSSDSLRLRPIGYHINNGVQDFWIRIDTETTIDSGTANYPSSGSWAYVLGDKDGNITLAAATGTAAQRPTDAYFKWGELGGTGYDHTRQGYYASATQRILGAIHKVSATSFYFISMMNENDERGENSRGTWEINKRILKQYSTLLAGTASTLVANHFGTTSGNSYYNNQTWTFPVPFASIILAFPGNITGAAATVATPSTTAVVMQVMGANGAAVDRRVGAVGYFY